MQIVGETATPGRVATYEKNPTFRKKYSFRKSGAHLELRILGETLNKSPSCLYVGPEKENDKTGGSFGVG